MKRLLAAVFTLCVCGLLLCTPAMLANAALENVCDKQDNKEVVYTSTWEQPSKWKMDPIDPDDYTGDAKMWFDKITIPYSTAQEWAKNETPVTVNLNVTGAAGAVNQLSLHTYFDTRLEPVPQKKGKDLAEGTAVGAFYGDSMKIDAGQYVFVASGSRNDLKDGTIFSIDFKLPKNVKAGDLYPIGLQYWTDGITTDLFMNVEQNAAGKLQMAYMFTKGIENGYIKIEAPTCQISFDANGGSGTMSPITAPEGSTITLPECGFYPSYGGKFLKWVDIESGSYYSSGERITVSSNMTFRAIWSSDCRIYFSAGGGNGSMSEVFVPRYSEYTLPECRFIAPEGRHFVGWIVGDSLSDTLYKPGDKVSVDQMLFRVQAVWSKVTGKCGDKLEWTYDTKTKTLTITGTGAMYDYEQPEDVPWYTYREELENVVFPEGMTSVGDNAFRNQYAVKEITLPKTVTKIGISAFESCNVLTDIIILNPAAQISDSQWTICNVTRATSDGYKAFFKGTICGYAGSTAQAYAEKYGYKFRELTRIYPKTTEGFVTRMYNVALNREPDAAGLNSWVKKLNNHTATAADIINGFFFSSEYQGKNKTADQMIEDCYKAMLDRAPDATGRTNWKNRLSVGMSIQSICKGFVGSSEFKGLCSYYGITPGNITLKYARDENYERTYFIYRLYKNCLGRNPSASEVENWCKQIKAGKTGSSIAYGFIFSKEYKGKNVSNSQFVDMLYRTILGRSGDSSGVKSWTAKLDAKATRESVFNGFLFSTEFKNQCDKAGIKVGSKV